MKITAMAGRRARVPTVQFDRASLIAIIPIILASRAGISGIYPFGVSIFAALLPSYFGAAALAVGAATLGVTSIKYILTAASYLAVTYLKKLDRIASAAVLALMMSVFGILQMLFFEPSVMKTVGVLAESAATGLLFYIFASLYGRNTPKTYEKQLARLLILGAVAGGFSGLVIPPAIHASIFVGLIFSMLIATSLTLTQSVTASIVIGLVAGLDNIAVMSVVCVFALSSLFASLLKELGKWGVALGYLCGLALVLLLGENIYDAQVYISSVCAGVIIYLILPDFAIMWVQEKVRSVSGLYETGEEYKRVAKRIKSVTKQHREISTVLKHINDEIEKEESANIKEALYCVNTVVAQRADGGGSVSGDCFLEFDVDNSRHCAVLCDGMGSGQRAYRESRMTAELMGEFLMTGFLKDKAVRMLNTALAIKGDDESFSTVDLFEFDKWTGDAEFLKIGSAESFIKHKEEVETLSSSSLPVGILEDVRSSTENRRLYAGDIVVMVSDGVGEAGYGVLKGEWIKRMIKTANSDIKRLADEILAEAVKRCYPEKDDDMTVVVMRIERARNFE